MERGNKRGPSGCRDGPVAASGCVALCHREDGDVRGNWSSCGSLRDQIRTQLFDGDAGQMSDPENTLGRDLPISPLPDRAGCHAKRASQGSSPAPLLVQILPKFSHAVVIVQLHTIRKRNFSCTVLPCFWRGVHQSGDAQESGDQLWLK